MHRWVVLCAVMVCQVSVHAQQSKVRAKVVFVQLLTVTALPERCGPEASSVYACTQFVGHDLSAICGANGDGWSIHARANFMALMYVVDRAFIGHELLHIGDMERAINLYVEGLEKRRFSSASVCTTAALAESETFSQTMRAFADRSNATRH